MPGVCGKPPWGRVARSPLPGIPAQRRPGVKSRPVYRQPPQSVAARHRSAEAQARSPVCDIGTRNVLPPHGTETRTACHPSLMYRLAPAGEWSAPNPAARVPADGAGLGQRQTRAAPVSYAWIRVPERPAMASAALSSDPMTQVRPGRLSANLMAALTFGSMEPLPNCPSSR